MTRINLLPPRLLTDQHLIAEKKEINQLAGQLLKSLRSPNFDYNTLPKHYVLGTGHVRWWYTKGTYIRNRFKQIYEECLKRNFKVENNFNDVWFELGIEYNYNFIPTQGDYLISHIRIAEKIKLKPNFYRYYGKPIQAKEFISNISENI